VWGGQKYKEWEEKKTRAQRKGEGGKEKNVMEMRYREATGSRRLKSEV